MSSEYDERGGRNWQRQSERWTVDDHKDVATMSAGRAEEDEGRMVPRPVEQQERILGNTKHGVVGEHHNYISKIDDKHGEYIAKIGVDKILADTYKCDGL